MIPFVGKGLVYLIAAAAVLSLLFGLYKSIYNSGYRAGEQLLKNYVAEQTQKTLIVEKEVEKLVTVVETKYVDRIKTVRMKGETIVKEVPVYVTKSDDVACELRAGFVRVHDAAASNTPAEPAAESDRDPAGVALSQTLATIADNYTQYYACRQKVIGWNEFWNSYIAAVKDAGCVSQR